MPHPSDREPAPTWRLIFIMRRDAAASDPAELQGLRGGDRFEQLVDGLDELEDAIDAHGGYGHGAAEYLHGERLQGDK